MVTIVGHCSCTQAVQEIPELCSLHLPTPDWPETALVARSHYPGGCDVGRGVWACVDSRSTHNHIWRILTSKTNMLVCSRVPALPNNAPRGDHVVL